MAVTPIVDTDRKIWPGSRFAEELAGDLDVLLTIWLRPQANGRLDTAQAASLSAMPPAKRTYTDRKALATATGSDPADIARVRDFCRKNGLNVVSEHWRSLCVSASLDRLIQTFGATVATFIDDSGRRFRHRSRALHVPHEIAEIVRGVFGLHQWPRSRKLGALQRHATPLRASDVIQRYRFPQADGAGQTVGVLQLRGVFSPDDFDLCMTAQRVAAARPFIKRVDDAAVEHELATTKDLEAALDVQLIALLAPKARVVVYEAPDDERGFLDAIRNAIFDEEYAPDVLSISYGWPEMLWTPIALAILGELSTAAALAGMTICCSSGDNGAELGYDGKPHVLAPASAPFVVACGATTITDAQAEVAWAQTGGGFSARFDIPPWQQSAAAIATRYGVPAGRGVPDVAAQEEPGYYVVMEGTELAMGGTSAVAPVWSALIALINQRLGARAGFFLPVLYAQSNGRCFNGVTTGDNGFYRAQAGWNPCTGLGTPIGVEIENALRAASP